MRAVSKNKLIENDWDDSDQETYEETFTDRIKDKREKLLRATELRRKIEDRMESRRLRDQCGDLDSYSF